MSYDPRDDEPIERKPSVEFEPYEGEFDESTGLPIGYEDCRWCDGHGLFLDSSDMDDPQYKNCTHCDGTGNVRVK